MWGFIAALSWSSFKSIDRLDESRSFESNSTTEEIFYRGVTKSE